MPFPRVTGPRRQMSQNVAENRLSPKQEEAGRDALLAAGADTPGAALRRPAAAAAPGAGTPRSERSREDHMTRRRHTEDQIERAVQTVEDLIADGASQSAACRQVATEIEASPMTVRSWLMSRSERLDELSKHLDAKKVQVEAANQARTTYAREKRLQSIDKAFGKLDGLLDAVKDAGDFQKLCTALGILIDKRRLEDGESTEVREQRNRTDILSAALAAGEQRLRAIS